MKFGCVLMAAGLASRFGENKLLYCIEGSSLIARAVRAVPPSLFQRAVAVVSSQEVRAVAEAAGYTCLINPAPERGQGNTITLGGRAMEGMDAVMFCVADQPYLRPETIRRMLRTYEPGTIRALAWHGRRGNPVLFPSACLALLCGLSPEQTGKAVIAHSAHLLRLMEAEDERELWDIDTKDDLRFGE